MWDDEFGIYTTGSNGAYQHGDWGSWSGLEPSNYFQNWERPVSIEFYNSNQDYQFSFDAGIKIHGGTSRILPQKSVSLHFRDKYGNESIDYRFFNDKSIHEFETFILRNSGSDWLSRDTGTMFRME